MYDYDPIEYWQHTNSVIYQKSHSEWLRTLKFPIRFLGQWRWGGQQGQP